MKTIDLVSKRLHALWPLLTLLLLGVTGCTETPDEPDGQGRVRAVHAVPELGTVGFFIEALSLSQLSYQETGDFEVFDSLNYDFNFDTVDGATAQTRRLTSETLTLVPDSDYTFFVTGTPTAPVVSIAVLPELIEDSAATTLELWFANLSRAAGNVDLYLGEAGFDPAAATPLASADTAAFSALVTVEAAAYQLVATRSGDPADVLIRTELIGLPAGERALVSLFDSAGADTGAFTFTVSTETANNVRLVDTAAPSQIQLVHASPTVGPVDVLVSGATTPLIAGQTLGQTSAPTTVEGAGSEELTLTVTPAGNPGVPLVEQSVVLVDAGVNFIVLFGDQGDETLQLARTAVPRLPVFDAARFGVFDTVLGVERIQFYLLREDDVLEDSRPILISPAQNGSRFLASTVIGADNYRMVVTNFADDSILAGPIDLPLSAGDIRQIVLADTVDPNVVDVLVIDPLNP